MKDSVTPASAQCESGSGPVCEAHVGEGTTRRAVRRGAAVHTTPRPHVLHPGFESSRTLPPGRQTKTEEKVEIWYVCYSAAVQQCSAQR